VSDKPTAAWYLAPIFFGIIGSAIMWYVLKDEDHPDAPKMVKKGWVIGIILTVISFAWIPLMLIPFAFMGMGQQQMHQPPIPEPIPRLVTEPTPQEIPEPVQQKVPAPGFEDVPEMIVESENNCDPSYPDVCITPWPPDLDCGEIQFANFKVLPDDPHGFDADNDGIGCESGSTQSSTPVQPSQPKEISCDTSYPDVCIPVYPPDLDCGEIQYANFRVVGSDPHGFDRDKDGIGCES